MARGGGGSRGGKGGGGGGKKTARSQSYNYLRRFGYPSSQELRMEAQGLASASVPTVRQVSTPYNQQIRSTKDYLAAVQSALADTTAGVNQGYDASLAQSQGVDAAANARLAGLGLGADSAGVQAAQGARGDSATQALIANAAAAKGAAAQNPAIAAGQASQFAQVTGNKLIDALANRRDALSQAFFQALSQVKQEGLATAQFNQSQSQFLQNAAMQKQQNAQAQANTDRAYNEGVREFNISRKDAKQQAAAASLSPSEYRQEASIVAGYAGGKPAETAKIPQYGPNGHIIGYRTTTVKGTGTPNVALQGQSFTTVLQALVQQGVSPQVAIPMLRTLYTDPILVHAPKGTDQWHAYQSYLKFVDPHYGHHSYEGEHGQKYTA